MFKRIAAVGIAVGAGLLLAGCSTMDSDIEGANWEGSRLSGVMPNAARRAGQEGSVFLFCSLAANNVMTDCLVLKETPEGWGFGAAALRMQPGLRAREGFGGQTLGNLEGRPAIVPLAFCMPDEPGASACRARSRAEAETFSRLFRETLMNLKAKDCAAARRTAAQAGSKPLSDHVEKTCVAAAASPAP